MTSALFDYLVSLSEGSGIWSIKVNNNAYLGRKSFNALKRYLNIRDKRKKRVEFVGCVFRYMKKPVLKNGF